MGDVVTGKYQFTLNTWKMNFGRSKVVSFVPGLTERFLCLVIPNPPKFDPGLLYRPLAKGVWICIFISLSLASCFGIIPHIFIKGYENMISNQISMISFWFLFVLLNAFYGGALTMFFVAEISIPFNTMRDVLKLFPEWKLLVAIGSKTIVITEPALSVSAYIFTL